jgi:hypothetical protein
MKAAAVLDVPELLTTAEVAALLKVNRSPLSRWRSVGAAPGSLAHSHHPPLPTRRRHRVSPTGFGLTIRKQPSGRWFAVLKSGRAYVSARTFDTRRDAQAWLAREQAALAAGGGGPSRRSIHGTDASSRVAGGTEAFCVSEDLHRGRCACSAGIPLPGACASQPFRIGRSRRALIALSRFRDSLSSFFAWAVWERMIPTNPVTPTRVPKSSTPRTEMYPLARRSWRSSYSRAVQRDQRLADILLIDAWTGPPLVRAASRAGSRLHRSSAACLGGAARKGAYF